MLTHPTINALAVKSTPITTKTTIPTKKSTLLPMIPTTTTVPPCRLMLIIRDQAWGGINGMRCRKRQNLHGIHLTTLQKLLFSVIISLQARLPAKSSTKTKPALKPPTRTVHFHDLETTDN